MMILKGGKLHGLNRLKAVEAKKELRLDFLVKDDQISRGRSGEQDSTGT